MKTALTLILCAVFLVGCGTSADNPDTGSDQGFSENRVVQIPITEDGVTKNVTCVWLKNGYGGGASCDWVGFHR